MLGRIREIPLTQWPDANFYRCVRQVVHWVEVFPKSFRDLRKQRKEGGRPLTDAPDADTAQLLSGFGAVDRKICSCESEYAKSFAALQLGPMMARRDSSAAALER